MHVRNCKESYEQNLDIFCTKQFAVSLERIGNSNTETLSIFVLTERIRMKFATASSLVLLASYGTNAFVTPTKSVIGKFGVSNVSTKV